VICEKPLVINPRNRDPLQGLERETGKSISTVLQLRVHPALIALKSSLNKFNDLCKHDVVLTHAIDLVHRIRHSSAVKLSGEIHPSLIAGLSHGNSMGE